MAESWDVPAEGITKVIVKDAVALVNRADTDKITITVPGRRADWHDGCRVPGVLVIRRVNVPPSVSTGGNITNQITGGVQHGPVFQLHSLQGSLSIGAGGVISGLPAAQSSPEQITLTLPDSIEVDDIES